MRRHGTRSCYVGGCRCEPCREAARLYRRQRIASKPASYLRELEQTRLRKLRYAGTCATCGGKTDGSNGRANAPKICYALRRSRRTAIHGVTPRRSGAAAARNVVAAWAAWMRDYHARKKVAA